MEICQQENNWRKEQETLWQGPDKKEGELGSAEAWGHSCKELCYRMSLRLLLQARGQTLGCKPQPVFNTGMAPSRGTCPWVDSAFWARANPNRILLVQPAPALLAPHATPSILLEKPGPDLSSTAKAEKMQPEPKAYPTRPGPCSHVCPGPATRCHHCRLSALDLA